MDPNTNLERRFKVAYCEKRAPCVSLGNDHGNILEVGAGMWNFRVAELRKNLKGT
jgi:hypothetical protein